MRKILVLVLAVIMISIVSVGCGETATNTKVNTNDVSEYIWPTTGICQKLPQPNSKFGVIEYDSADAFEMRVYNVSANDFTKYIAACKEAGFTVDYAQYEDSFDAYDDEGYSIWLSYELGAKTMTIELWAPDDDDEELDMDSTETTSITVEDTTVAIDTTTSTIATEAIEDNQTSGAIRPDFKNAMDSYEDFFKSYCEFMKKYQKNPSDMGLLMDYAKFMQQYSETMEKMENLKSDNLNTAELAYYTEVTARITKMLLEVTE